jgi:hypothetical protein
MRFVLKLLIIISVFVILTVVTQVGGIIFLMTLLASRFINRFIINASLFLVLYSIATFIAIPVIAKQYGRVRLPIIETNGLKPRTIWTCILNRNYAKPALYNVAVDVTSKIRQQYPGTVVNYLDSSFPFFDKMPLFPHLSHGDGRKLDIAFQYIDRLSDKPSSTTPSSIGYGAFEGPRDNEFNQQQLCRQQGFSKYNSLPATGMTTLNFYWTNGERDQWSTFLRQILRSKRFLLSRI